MKTYLLVDVNLFLGLAETAVFWEAGSPPPTISGCLKSRALESRWVPIEYKFCLEPWRIFPGLVLGKTACQVALPSLGGSLWKKSDFPALWAAATV